jgi:transposase
MNEERRNEIVYRWHRGQSMRTIARQLHVSRNTIRRVLAARTSADGNASAEGDGSYRQRTSLLDPFETTIRSLLQRYPEISITRLLNELRNEGYQGSYTILRLRVQQIRRELVVQEAWDYAEAPGALAHVEFVPRRLSFASGEEGLYFLFRYQLAYSRYQYMRVVRRRDLATTMYLHVEAFDFLGGSAATSSYWQTPAVLAPSMHDSVPKIHPRFLDFASHYGFQPQAARQPVTSVAATAPFEPGSMYSLDRPLRSLDQLNDVLSQSLQFQKDHTCDRANSTSLAELFEFESRHLVPLPHRPWGA